MCFLSYVEFGREKWCRSERGDGRDMEEVRGKIKVQVQSVNVIKVYSMLVCKNHNEAHYFAFMLF